MRVVHGHGMPLSVIKILGRCGSLKSVYVTASHYKLPVCNVHYMVSTAVYHIRKPVCLHRYNLHKWFNHTYKALCSQVKVFCSYGYYRIAQAYGCYDSIIDSNHIGVAAGPAYALIGCPIRQDCCCQCIGLPNYDKQ